MGLKVGDVVYLETKDVFTEEELPYIKAEILDIDENKNHCYEVGYLTGRARGHSDWWKPGPWLIPEDVFNSPLFNTMKEDEETT